ncbi:hypothetical protein OPV22_003458 [Ensete ventricosum]|uniref:Uncharacterized protein n=1 Tax=Ensete ventricosum TaxID=4639 RepID=A0AAV8S112_ENSVE|nr:hypothetical protein OPV22_003458 [Ensete ventricosum]
MRAIELAEKKFKAGSTRNLHKNPSAAADGAFKLIMEAWTRLSSSGNAHNGDEDHSADSNSNKRGRNTKPNVLTLHKEKTTAAILCALRAGTTAVAT